MITVPAGFRASALETFGAEAAEFCATLPLAAWSGNGAARLLAAARRPDAGPRRRNAREVGPHSANLLVHTDLHYEHVLATLPGTAEHRRQWLAIDPKPVAGGPGFGALPAMWNRLDDLARAVETVGWNAEIGLVQEQLRPAWVAETLATP